MRALTPAFSSCRPLHRTHPVPTHLLVAAVVVAGGVDGLVARVVQGAPGGGGGRPTAGAGQGDGRGGWGRGLRRFRLRHIHTGRRRGQSTASPSRHMTNPQALIEVGIISSVWPPPSPPPSSLSPPWPIPLDMPTHARIRIQETGSTCPTAGPANASITRAAYVLLLPHPTPIPQTPRTHVCVS